MHGRPRVHGEEAYEHDGELFASTGRARITDRTRLTRLEDVSACESTSFEADLPA